MPRRQRILRHSGERQRVRAKRGPMTGSARTSDVQLHIGESRDSGSGPFKSVVADLNTPSRNDSRGTAHGCKRKIYPRRTTGTRLSFKFSASWRLALTFGVWLLWFAQSSRSPSGQMRNKITKLLIVVVPRRTAGDG